MTNRESEKSSASQQHPLIRLTIVEQRVLDLEIRLAQLEQSRRDVVSRDQIGNTLAVGQVVAVRASSAFQILAVGGRITETNSEYYRYAWKLRLKSLSSQAIQVDVTIQFVDKDGFVVEDAIDYGLVLEPLREQDFTGYSIVRLPGATTIENVRARVELAD